LRGSGAAAALARGVDLAARDCMTNEALAVLTVFGSTGALVGLGLLGRSLLFADRHDREQQRRLACPRSGARVDCVLLRDVDTGRWTGVHACSAFSDPEKIACTGDCVDRLNAEARGVAAV
jgi:hypothetical protein